jgi:hypothetical protein
MSQQRRWIVASLLSVVAVASAWCVCQWGFGLDVATSATVAALAAAVAGTPMATWAGSSQPAAPSPPTVPVHGDVGDHALAAAPRTTSGFPRVWNIPPRSPVFTGRDSMLLALRDQLRAGGPVEVLALHGMGGVGKPDPRF